MSKPRKGGIVYYTDKYPGRKAGEKAGIVTGFSSDTICHIENKGITDSFIFVFRDGWNNFFTWEGKDESIKHYELRE